MPAINPRITITLTPSIHAILKRLSQLSGDSQSALVAGLLQTSAPVFERMVTVLEAAHRLKEEARRAPDEIQASLESAQARLEGQFGLALSEIDEGFRPMLEEAEKVSRRGARAAKRPPSSNRGVTPHQKAGSGPKVTKPRGRRHGSV